MDAIICTSIRALVDNTTGQSKIRIIHNCSINSMAYSDNITISTFHLLDYHLGGPQLHKKNPEQNYHGPYQLKRMQDITKDDRT